MFSFKTARFPAPVANFPLFSVGGLHGVPAVSAGSFLIIFLLFHFFCSAPLSNPANSKPQARVEPFCRPLPLLNENKNSAFPPCCDREYNIDAPRSGVIMGKISLGGQYAHCNDTLLCARRHSRTSGRPSRHRRWCRGGTHAGFRLRLAQHSS